MQRIRPTCVRVGLLAALAFLISALLGWRFLHGYLVPDHLIADTEVQGPLGRPLRVGIVEWPGYAGGIVANNGFKPNKRCIFWTEHRLLVEFVLVEDADTRAKAFASGGLDIIWSTVDFWANELPGFLQGGVPARAIMQVDWSRGGDAIVADEGIHRIEDLVGKHVSLALFTPSQWLLEYTIDHSTLNQSQQSDVINNLVAKNSSPDARADFVAGKVDAAVVWEPDVTEALRGRPGAHIMLSTKMLPNLIADIMVTRLEFIKEHPDVVAAFVGGWLDGTEEANRNRELVGRLLTQNEPLYRNLGYQATSESLHTVKWAGLGDNIKMFGLTGGRPLFDQIFEEASKAWVKRGYITRAIPPAEAKDDEFLKVIYGHSKGTRRLSGDDPNPPVSGGAKSLRCSKSLKRIPVESIIDTHIAGSARSKWRS